MRAVVLYCGEGVAINAFHHLSNSIKALLSNYYFIQAVDHRFFLTQNWEASTDLIVFPGGRDLYYHKALQGEPNTRIRQFVEKGGRYLGFCAGGYYGATHIEFEKGGELEVVGSRELAFFPGKAIGPAYGKGVFSYQSDSGARAALIAWEKGLSSIYFNGGCYFDGAEKHSSIEVLGRYHDLEMNPAAVIYCRVGQGVAILSGVHPEFSEKETVDECGRKAFLKYLVNKILT